MKRKILLLSAIVLILIGMYFASASTSLWPAFNICCEKTKTGAWCQNSQSGSCDDSVDDITGQKYRSSPTSCDATSFCKMGCCIDTSEGLCMENSPLMVCQQTSGTWVEDPQCNVAQCSLGCCILGDQASFVTLTRCKRLSNIYGLTTNFKKEVTDEAKCIMMAYSQDKGACVYEQDSDKTCKFTTRQECTDVKQSGNITSTSEFFKDYLCSADELATNCGPTEETMCVDGKDEVYFKDTCGNPANIYDANKVYSKSSSYWKKVYSKTETCGANTGNINSKTCGNCDYLDGSLCGDGKASYGDKICKDLNCYNTENGESYKNGESWCEYQGETGYGMDLVGSRQFRHVCIHGEETVEPCADFRNEICIQSTVEGTSGDFIEAGCRSNRWQDCIDQNEQYDCENTDKRDCFWMEGYYYSGNGGNNDSSTSDGSGILPSDLTDEDDTNDGICLPMVPPGLKFWDSSDAQAVCSLGNSVQIVNYTTDFWGDTTCEDNCEALEESWAIEMNDVCIKLGDCGAKSNIAGQITDGGFDWKIDGEEPTTLYDDIVSYFEDIFD